MSPKKKARKATPHSLEGVARRELDVTLDKEHQSSDWGGEMSPGMVEYAARDAEILLPMAESLTAKVADAALEKVSEIERRALPAMVWMQNAGLPLNARGWTEHLRQVEQEIDFLKKRLREIAPVRPGGKEWNWNSSQQIKEVFALKGIELPNAQSETLSRYDHPLVAPLLRYSKTSKLVSTFGPGLLKFVREDGRVYADWRQIGAETGRMSCSRPNLQQFPPALKDYVRAPAGRSLVVADYSQAELRIAAQISGDERMLGAYRRGEDLHATTARSLMGRENISKEERNLAKAVNFGLLYGQGAQGLMEYARNKYGVTMTLEEAKRYRRRFFETYPGLKAWHNGHWRKLKRGSTETRTLSGRRRRGVRSFNERVNAPVQGTGSDIQKLALALLYERRHERPGAFPIACVHDEIAVECGEGEVEGVAAWLEKAMTDAMTQILSGDGADNGTRVPAKVEVKSGSTWGGCAPLVPEMPAREEQEKRDPGDHFRSETSRVLLYVDYRDLSAGNYPCAALCSECVEDLGSAVEFQDAPEWGSGAACDLCGRVGSTAREPQLGGLG